jgi:hypothetical protein
MTISEYTMTELVYRSYLLRLWRDHPGAPWRATLIDVVQPEEQRHFAALEALFVFLATQTVPAQTQAHEHCNAEDTR